MNLLRYDLHSGGANGSDSYWELIGADSKLEIVPHHYYYGVKTPRGNHEITESEFLEGKEKVMLANETLKRVPYKYMNLLARNWMQIKMSDEVFAIGSLSDPENLIVDGGTGWAVQMAIDARKQVNFFDQDLNKWFRLTDDFKKFYESECPILTPNFAGIGTRKINANGIRAITDVYLSTEGELLNT